MEQIDRLDYMALAGQVQALKRQQHAQTKEQEALETRRVLAAYAQLATNASFLIVLESWIQRVLLVPLTNEQEMGKHNFLVSILAELRTAGTMTQLSGGLR